MRRILITVCFFAFLLSCSNDDPLNLETQESNFYALTVGNSWVYKSQQYNFNIQLYEDTEIIDSVSIVGTEDILGNTYFKFRTKTTGSVDGESQFSNPNGIKFEYFREVDGNLVKDSNDIVFTTTDYTEKLVVEASWGSIFEKLVQDLATVEVPAGTFECYNKQRYARTLDGEDLPSMDNFYYAEGVGLIYDSVSFISQENPIIIRRLDAYTIQ